MTAVTVAHTFGSQRRWTIHMVFEVRRDLRGRQGGEEMETAEADSDSEDKEMLTCCLARG